MAASRPLAVLYVEPDRVEARLLTSVLRDLWPDGFAMVPVLTLAAALEALAAGDFDVALVELALPDARGLTAVSELRAAAPGLPVVVLTEDADAEDSLEAVRAGVQDVLVKGASDGVIVGRALRHAVVRKHAVEELLRRADP